MYYPNFINVLPLDDITFVGDLVHACDMFPGNTKDTVIAQTTRADKAAEFLKQCIEPGFSYDGNSNQLLDKLLLVMEHSDFPATKHLAKTFKGMCVCA